MSNFTYIMHNISKLKNNMREIKIKGLPYKFYTFDTIGDGSCFLHGVMYCFNLSYRKASPGERIKMVSQLRKNLSNVLEEKRKDGKTYYEILSRGEIKELSKIHPKLKLNHMQNYLNSRHWIDIFYLELISDQLNIDILIYDEYRKNFYRTGDDEIYIKGRETILLNYQDGMHFEAVGVKLDKIRTFFSSDSSIIKKIKKIYYPT